MSRHPRTRLVRRRAAGSSPRHRQRRRGDRRHPPQARRPSLNAHRNVPQSRRGRWNGPRGSCREKPCLPLIACTKGSRPPGNDRVPFSWRREGGPGLRPSLSRLLADALTVYAWHGKANAQGCSYPPPPPLPPPEYSRGTPSTAAACHVAGYRPRRPIGLPSASASTQTRASGAT
jgi:hypothetical protein